MGFIEEIASYVCKYAKQYGILVHSPIIAQAILESASGTSNKVKVEGIGGTEWRHNYFGLKWRNGRCAISNEYFEEWTSEQRKDGSRYNKVERFCKFNSMEDCVIGYFQWTNIANYANLKGVTDPRTYLENIKKDKYATSIDYVDNLMAVIEKYDLTKYDNMEDESIMSKRTVFLSAGHGGTNPGAVALGLTEKVINLNTLLACKNVLERHGVNVVCSRVKDENDDVYEEVREANASGAEIAISFHANAGGGDGFEVFYFTGDVKGEKLARLGEKYVKALGQNSRGVKSGNHLYFVKKTTMTAVLFESFFLDNDKDNDIGDTVAEQQAFGVAYAKAILEYLGIAYKDATAGKEPEKPTETKKLYRVQVGAFSVKENAEEMQKKLKAAGFGSIIV